MKSPAGFILVLALLAVVAPVQRAQPNEAVAVSSGVEYQYLQTYSVDRLNTILSSELDEFMRNSTMPTQFHGKVPSAVHAVRLYRIKYRSVVPELDNRPTTASGLIAIPDTGATTMPMVSYQHGTVFDKSAVPSNPEESAETRIMIGRFASQGYVVIAADYFGRGISDLPDSYLVRDSTRQASYDMLLAARDVLSSMRIVPSHLFVSGWSQGGWATMVYLQKLEEVGEKVTAAAAASAPVDVYLTVSRWLNNPRPVDAVYLPGVVTLQLLAQEFYLQETGLAEAAIRPDYLQAARALYAGQMDWETFRAQTPPTLQAFIRPEFRAGAYLGQAPYWRVLERNQAYRWTSVTPLRTYYGGKDEVTPIYIGRLPAETQALTGGAVAQAVDAGSMADHRAVFIYGVIDQKDWFDTFLGHDSKPRSD